MPHQPPPGGTGVQQPKNSWVHTSSPRPLTTEDTELLASASALATIVGLVVDGCASVGEHTDDCQACGREQAAIRRYLDARRAFLRARRVP